MGYCHYHKEIIVLTTVQVCHTLAEEMYSSLLDNEPSREMRESNGSTPDPEHPPPQVESRARHYSYCQPTFETKFGYHLHNESINVPEEVWNDILPVEFKLLRDYFLNQPIMMKYYRFGYLVLSILLLIFTVSEQVKDYLHGISTPMLIYSVVFLIQACMYVSMPFVCMKELVEALHSDDLPIIFKEATRYDPNFVFKFAAITHLNFFLLFIAIAVYTAFVDQSLSFSLPQTIFSLVFLGPFTYSCSLSIMILEAHRLQSHKFEVQLADMRQMYIRSGAIIPSLGASVTSAQIGPIQDPLLSDSDLINRYYILHARCVHTSEKRGKHFFAIFLYSGVLVIGSAYAVINEAFSVLTVLFFTLLDFFVFLEVGLSLVAINELGSIVQRNLATTRLCLLRHTPCYQGNENSGVMMQEFLECVAYARLEIAFFGNFALRSNMLLAAAGTIIAAIIPSVLVYIFK